MRFIATTIAIFGLAVCGCSASDGTTTNQPDPATDSTDRGELQGELGTVTQKLGEATCGNIAADETWDYAGLQAGAGTADNTYGHPECTDGYIVDVLNVPSNGELTGGIAIPRYPDPFTCLFHWGYLSLWKQGGTGYVKIAESSSLGVWGSLPQIGTVCVAQGRLTVPAPGNYRVVAASGVLFGPKGSVSISR
jgi:hypothetical protein